MEKINIIFNIDNNYASFLGVTLCSIFENKTCKNPIDVYVLDGGIHDDNKSKLKILEDRYGFKINYIKIDISFFDNFKLTGYFTSAVYYRLMIPVLLPHLDKTLYLDCDIVVAGDLLELFNTNIDNYYYAAVEDEDIRDRQKELGMPPDAKYSNSGVILINSKKWRNSKISEKIISFIKDNPDKLKYCDQDAINAILYDKWLPMPFRYNYMASLFYKFNIKKDDLRQNGIIIIHYTGLKPWNYLYTYRFKEQYFNYLEKTPWSGKKVLDKNFKNIILKPLLQIANNFLPKFITNFLKKVKNKLKIKLYNHA